MKTRIKSTENIFSADNKSTMNFQKTVRNLRQCCILILKHKKNQHRSAVDFKTIKTIIYKTRFTAL